MPNLPKNLVTDAGYGSEENYHFIKRKALGNFVKYASFQREQHNFAKDRFRVNRFKYDPKTDQYFCPVGQRLFYRENKTRKSDNGYLSSVRIYQAQHCCQCKFKKDCSTSEANRSIQINHQLNEFKQHAKKNLLSSLGIKLRKLRSVEAESVFAQIKHNLNFRKFNLRNLQNVSIEWGLVALAHNLKKIPA